MTAPLITRLEEAAEEAAEGSRELDLRVFEHFDRVNGERWTDADLDYALTDPDRTINPPHLTTSIDAALALATRVLPEMNCTGFDKTPLGVEAYVSRNNVNSGHWVETGWHKSSPAIALCIAILKANHKDKP